MKLLFKAFIFQFNILRLRICCLHVKTSEFHQISDSVLCKKQIPPTAQQKITDKYSDAAISWKKVHSLPFRTTLDSKLREFQYKTLNNIVCTNDKLYSLRPFALSKLLILQ